MKKRILVVCLSILILGASFKTVQYFTDLTVNGSIIKTDPTYSSTFTIKHSANNQITFNDSYIGDFMIAGPGNAVDYGVNGLTALYRGAVFSASVGGGVQALATGIGDVNFNQNSGTTLIGPNIINDGSSQLQIKGTTRTDSLKVYGGNIGDVLTKSATGTFVPKPPSGGGGTGGTYSPIGYGVTNINSITLYGATYSKSGNSVTVELPFALSTTNGGGAQTVFDISLPFTAANTSVINGGTVTTNYGTYGASGIASISTTTKMRINFNTPVTNPSGYIIFMYTAQ